MSLLVVWDFHGTLEKGNEHAVKETSNDVLEQFGYLERFTDEDMHRLYGLKWQAYFAYLLPEDLPERHAELQNACVNHPQQEEIIKRHIRPNDYAHEVINEIARQGHSQILVSNTQPLALRIFLEAVALHEVFPPEVALAADNHQDGKHTTKIELLQAYLQGKSFDRLIVVGDTRGDMEMADFVCARACLYAHPGRAFPDVRRDRETRDLRDILLEL